MQAHIFVVESSIWVLTPSFVQKSDFIFNYEYPIAAQIATLIQITPSPPNYASKKMSLPPFAVDKSFQVLGRLLGDLDEVGAARLVQDVVRLGAVVQDRHLRQVQEHSALITQSSLLPSKH